MGSVRRRAKRLESAVSACLLEILLLIGVGVVIKQSDYDMGRFGMDTATVSKFETPFDLSSLAPYGFKTLSGIETYSAENLYEKINGKAPFYIESGFEKLLTQRFVSKDNENLGMELYLFDMGTVKNAFSVYSVQRRAGAAPAASLLRSKTAGVADMRFAYRTSNALYFVHGKYYVEMVGWSESAEMFEALTETAQKIRSKLTTDKVTEIVELRFFPQEDLVSGSVRLYLADTFGFEGLTNTFTARYQVDGEIITAFLSRRVDSKEAEAIAQSYHRFLIENGAAVKNAADKTLQGRVFDFYGTTEIVLGTGPFVAGVHEAEDQQSAEKLAVRLISKLSEVAKAISDDRTK